MTKSLHWVFDPPELFHGRGARWAAAVLLRAASATLTRMARSLAAAESVRGQVCVAELEFYAEAGAPEGALYANGVLIGYLEGVKRL